MGFDNIGSTNECSGPLTFCLSKVVFLYSFVHATLKEALFVRPLVRPSVHPLVRHAPVENALQLLL